ncbi:MAG TPA: HlyD family efflux transporter periplasmic adaptor subunit [Alphaproteobacteria bacterium]|nr:HlyD family efflux transporter periplasmic adaptor subunit [Alphaproteobacteria bacterium]
MLNRIVIPALAVLAAVYALLATDFMQPDHQAQPPLYAPPRSPFPAAVAAVGLIEPASEIIAVAAVVPGAITAVHVAPNATVQQGQPLFSLDDRDLRAEIALRREGLAAAEARLRRLSALPRPEDVPIARAKVEAARASLADARQQLAFIAGIADQRGIRAEKLSRRRYAVTTAEAHLREAEAALKLLLAGAWQEDLRIARHEITYAKAAVARAEADLDRLTVRAPIDGTVLKLNARVGEYAPAGQLEAPLVLLGSAAPWHVRVDVNEEDAWRVRPEARAKARLRGNAVHELDLAFVRFEPYVIPKRALSGQPTERVDTRALQVIYRITSPGPSLFVGQQVDVFIEDGTPASFAPRLAEAQS